MIFSWFLSVYFPIKVGEVNCNLTKDHLHFPLKVNGPVQKNNTSIKFKVLKRFISTSNIQQWLDSYIPDDNVFTQIKEEERAATWLLAFGKTHPRHTNIMKTCIMFGKSFYINIIWISSWSGLQFYFRYQ